MLDGKGRREVRIDALLYAFKYPDAVTISDAPELHDNDARVLEVVAVLQEWDNDDPSTVLPKLFDWAITQGWEYRDLLSVVRYIGHRRQEVAKAEFTYQDRGSDRYDWPDRPIVRGDDGSAVPLGSIPIGWLMLTDRQISHGALRLYLVLWFYAKRMEDGTFRARVQYPRLQEHLSVSNPDTLRAWLKKLESAGYLEETDKTNGDKQKGRYSPKTYVLKIAPDRMPIIGTPNTVEKPL